MNDIVVKMEYGSHLYGLNHAGSDIDYATIVLPTEKEIIMQEGVFSRKQSTGDDASKNEAGDVDDEVMSLQKFVQMAMAGKNTAIDMLHAGVFQTMITSDIWEELQEKRHLFYTKDMSSYVDYVQGQAAKYGVKGSRLAALTEAMDYLGQFGTYGEDGHEWKLGEVIDDIPIGEHAYIVETEVKGEKQHFYEICQRKFDFKNKLPYIMANMQKIYDGYGHRAKKAESNMGVDWKAVSHALRAGYQAKYIYEIGGFTYPLPETDFIMDVKLGKCGYKDVVQPAIEELVAEVTRLAGASDLPETSDKEYWNNWIYEKHMEIVRGL